VGATERRRGSKAERDVAAYLRDHGWRAITTRAASGFQRGDDIATDAPVSIEVKDHARLDLAGWVTQARANAHGRPAVVWHKRRGAASPGAWYVTMLGEDLVELLRTIKDRD
jgi:Holliday junction resolvase